MENKLKCMNCPNFISWRVLYDGDELEPDDSGICEILESNDKLCNSSIDKFVESNNTCCLPINMQENVSK